MTTRHHQLDYIEFSAPDLAATTEFYGSVFGWEFNDYGGAYVGIKSAEDDGEVGGFDPSGAKPPLVQVYSDDLDASRAAVVAAGGTITQDVFEFPGGARFHFTDPAGNELGVWTQQSPKPL